MLELRAKYQEEGVPMTDGEICMEVLGKKSGYVRGLGPGPKPPSSLSGKTSNAELDEARKRADEAEKQTSKLTEEMENMKAKQAEMNAKQLETDALIKLMMDQLRRQRNDNPFDGK